MIIKVTRSKDFQGYVINVMNCFEIKDELKERKYKWLYNNQLNAKAWSVLATTIPGLVKELKYLTQKYNNLYIATSVAPRKKDFIKTFVFWAQGFISREEFRSIVRDMPKAEEFAKEFEGLVLTSRNDPYTGCQYIVGAQDDLQYQYREDAR